MKGQSGAPSDIQTIKNKYPQRAPNTYLSMVILHFAVKSMSGPASHLSYPATTFLFRQHGCLFRQSYSKPLESTLGYWND